METVIAGLQWDICLIYLDDVIVLGCSFEDMVINLKKVYDRLLAAGRKIKARKYHLFCKKIVYLGHVISNSYRSRKDKNCRIMASTNECQRITVIYGIMWVLEKIHSKLLKTSEMLAQTHRKRTKI